MPTDPTRPTVTIWTSAQRVPQAQQIIQHMGLAIQPQAIAGPRANPIEEFADQLGCLFSDDLRKLTTDQPSTYILLTTTTGVTREDIALAIDQGSAILTLEPLATQFDTLIDANPSTRANPTALLNQATKTTPAQPTSTHPNPATPKSPAQAPATTVYELPAMYQSPGWKSSADAVQVLGPPSLVSYAHLGQATDCSLYARLSSGWQTLLGLTGLPLAIDGSLVGPLNQAPQDLRGLTGHFCIHARYRQNCAATMVISDQAGPWERTVDVVTDQGHLRITDLQYRLSDADGKQLEQSPPPQHPVNYAKLVAMQWLDIIKQTPIPSTKPPNHRDAHVLACCQACLLSARTSQPESPQKLLSLHHR